MTRLATPLGAKTPPSRALRVLVALVAVSVVLVTLWYREGSSGPVHLLRSAGQTVAAPFRSVGAQLARPFANLAEALRDASADDDSLSELEARVTELSQQLAEQTELQEENARLEALLGLVSSYSMEGVGAHVISYSTDSWSDTATIDKGSLDGVALDMPVVCGSGVFGQVVEVAASSATVLLLSDPGSGVSAEVQSSGATGILTGSVDGTLRLGYVDADEQVAVGDLVVTSGLGGVYPRGLLLGTVASCTSTTSGLYYDITLTPGVATGGYDEVFVVTSFDADASGTQATDGDADASDASGTDDAEGGGES